MVLRFESLPGSFLVIGSYDREGSYHLKLIETLSSYRIPAERSNQKLPQYRLLELLVFLDFCSDPFLHADLVQGYGIHDAGQLLYWKENGWRTVEGKPYENEDLWNTFLKERQKTKLHHEISWKKGKLSQTLLRVDALAKHGANHPTLIDYGYKPGKFTATRTGIKKGALLFHANGQELLLRVYRKSIYGKNKNQIYEAASERHETCFRES